MHHQQRNVPPEHIVQVEKYIMEKQVHVVHVQADIQAMLEQLLKVSVIYMCQAEII